VGGWPASVGAGAGGWPGCAGRWRLCAATMQVKENINVTAIFVDGKLSPVFLL
jgi:hypothetical protein